MNRQKPKENNPAASLSSDGTQPTKRLVQNFFLVWLDESIDRSTQYFQKSLAQLQNIINDVSTFRQPDEAIDFLTDIDNASAFLIVKDDISAHILALIHNIPHLGGIYVLCGNNCQQQKWTQKWSKIKGVHTDITSICEPLQLATQQCDNDSISISFIAMNNETSNENLNQLEPSFMYTQLFKEILLEMQDDEISAKAFIDYCSESYKNNSRDSAILDEFQRTYQPKSVIWWYTRECFIYQMLNRALRTLEADTIINMGFFIRDLHRQVEQLHSEQIKSYTGEPFIVYRGQGLSKTVFEKLLKTKGGLMSFNNFLSTSRSRERSLRFAKNARRKTGDVCVLFQMAINPSISSTPFAAIQQYSCVKKEEEILFSMHAVFRIGGIAEINIDGPLQLVDLTLTADDDTELRTLTDKMRQEVTGKTGWERMGCLLMSLEELDRAEELYNTLRQQTSDIRKEAVLYHQLGQIKHHQVDYEKAIEYYRKALESFQKILPLNHPSLAICYGNMAGMYRDMGEHSKALSFYEKALEIFQNTLPANHPSLAACYGSIAQVYRDTGQYSKALLFYEKTLEILQKTLPPYHPSLAVCYNNMTRVYHDMGEYLKALSFSEKTLEIKQKTLPPNHPSLAAYYVNMAGVYCAMGEYSKALSFYEKAVEFVRKSLPANHLSLGICYGNMAGVYHDTGEYSKALSFYERELEIFQKSLLANHFSWTIYYDNMARLYHDMGEYSKALSFYEKELEIHQKSLPVNRPSLATCYGNIAGVYRFTGGHSKALSFYEKALEIYQESLPANHPLLATCYGNMAGVYCDMKEYSKALWFREKELEIDLKTLPANHPSLATCYGNIASVFYHIGRYAESLSYSECAQDIFQNSLPSSHSKLKQIQKTLKL